VELQKVIDMMFQELKQLIIVQLVIHQSLNSPWTHSQAEYYSFKTSAAGSEPLTSIRVSAKFGTNGIKISPALIPDACNDQYARACQGGNITCAHPVYGGEGW
jgi:hypothetical protein